MKQKYLIIGSASTDDPKTHGGTTLLVTQLLKYFKENEKDFIFIQAMKYQGRFAFILNYFYVIFKLLQNIRKVDLVMVNVASRGAYYLSPFVLFISRLFKRKFIFRKFAGNFIKQYEDSNGIKKKLIEYVINNADIMFFETKYLVKYYADIRPNVYWFPNIRKKSTVFREIDRPYQKKLVYLGQVRASKGLDELLEASISLDEAYSIDLYGSLFDDKYNESLLSQYPNVTYKGRVHNEKVYNILAQYDVLLLPSYMEGYPGVLIEAFGVGLPVISTNLPSIQEMVDGTNGLLIDPKSSEQLVEAIQLFNQDNYHDFARNALKKFQDFEYESVYKNITNLCEKNVNHNYNNLTEDLKKE